MDKFTLSRQKPGFSLKGELQNLFETARAKEIYP